MQLHTVFVDIQNIH